MPVSLANCVYACTTSLLTPSSTVSARRSPSPGKLLSTPPGSWIRADGGGGGNRAGSPGGCCTATGLGSTDFGCPSRLHRVRPTPASVATDSATRKSAPVQFGPSAAASIKASHGRCQSRVRPTESEADTPVSVEFAES